MSEVGNVPMYHGTCMETMLSPWELVLSYYVDTEDQAQVISKCKQL